METPSQNIMNAPGGTTLESADFECVTYDAQTGELIVRGTVPYGGGTVRLSPVQYVHEPEYWRIEVVWERPEVMMPAITPYEARLEQAPVGTRGLQIAGRTREMTITLNDA